MLQGGGDKCGTRITRQCLVRQGRKLLKACGCHFLLAAKESNQRKLPAWFRPMRVSDFAVPVPPVRSRGRFLRASLGSVVGVFANQNPVYRINRKNPGSDNKHANQNPSIV